MDQFLALLAGVVISVMISLNGGLTANLGVFRASVVIHVVGVLFALALCLLKRQRLFRRTAAPRWAYLGGVIGVLTTLFNNYSYSRISMTSLVALGLLGQCVAANLLDALGLLGMKKRAIRKTTLAGIALSGVGVAVMLDHTAADAFSAVLLSLGAGVTVVLSRAVNSRLSAETGPLAGSFYNHLAGLPVCLCLAAALPEASVLSALRPWMFGGGMLGVLVVALFNVVVPRLSAFRLSLLSFLGQIFSGIAIDLLFGRFSSPRLFWGGVLTGAGLLAGMLLERRETAR